MSKELAHRDPSSLSDEELEHYASAHDVRWIGFWPIPLLRLEHRRIWRSPYPQERTVLERYFPPWFAGQEFSIRNAIITKRSRNFYANNIVMAPSKFANQGFHSGLSPVVDAPTFAHELLHAMDRQLRGRLRIWSSYIERQLPDPKTRTIDENAYYEYDQSVTRPDQMLEQFRALNPEAQGELFEEGVRRSEALHAATDEIRDEARAQLEVYAEVLTFVRSCSRRDRLRER